MKRESTWLTMIRLNEIAGRKGGDIIWAGKNYQERDGRGQ